MNKEDKKISLKCSKCQSIYPENYLNWKCEKCGSPLEIIFEIEEKSRQLINFEDYSMWRYERFMAVRNESKVTLGEGWTPIIEKEIFGIKVALKLEFLNPTGSFKDRGASTVISRAVQSGVKRIVEDSSGNAGLAISAYASAAKIKAKIYVPIKASKAKKKLIQILGAQLIETKNRAEAFIKAVNELEENDYYVGHSWNPFFIEGVKTIAYEIAEQYNWKIPKTIIVPTGNGTLLLGLYKGFKELNSYGFIDEIPRLIAVQVSGYTPLYEAIYGKRDWNRKSRLADGIKISNPPRINEMKNAIINTNGDVIVVNDDEIIHSLKVLLKMGLIVEPTSATAIAALLKMKSDIEDNICIPLTGSGIKMPDKILRAIHHLNS